MGRFIQYVRSWFQTEAKAVNVLIPRDGHTISRKHISPNALKVLYRLHQQGYAAYLVGGGVRDLLLGRTPKDFDVATNARPEEMRKFFRNCRLIGRRFRLAHVYFEGEIIEVSTFRANVMEPTEEKLPSHIEAVPKMLLSDNTYGTIEEDAWRRDFTVNALYYNIADFSVVDYTQGVTDLENKVIRVIGDPMQRFHEDPIRMLRALRFAAKLDFAIDPATESLILQLKHLIFHVPKSRLFDEILKLFFEGHAYATYRLLVKTGYFAILFPAVFECLKHSPSAETLIEVAMKASDQRFATNQSLNPGYLLSVILWPVFQRNMEEQRKKKKSWFVAFSFAKEETLQTQMATLSLPRRMVEMIQSIWVLQMNGGCFL